MRARDSHLINIDKRRTFIGLDPVLFQLPQPNLVLHSNRNQWFLKGKAAAGRPISDQTAPHAIQVADGSTHVLPHLRMRVRGQVADDLGSV